MNHYHNDTIGVYTKTDNGLDLGGAVYFYNAQKYVIDDWVAHSESVFLAYHADIDSQIGRAHV